MIRSYDDLEEIRCPACGKLIKSQKGISGHCSRCKEWDNKIEVPYKEFDFEEHFKIKFHSPNVKEGYHFVRCKICEDNGVDFRKKRILFHVKKEHGLDKEQYLSLYPDAQTRAREMEDKKIETIREKYDDDSITNVFQAEEVKESYFDEDGTHVTQTKEAKEKRKKTMEEKYGHENPFGGKEGHERAVKGMLEKYGVENPQQHPQIRKKTLETTEKRYGKKYYVQTEEFREKFKAVCQEIWGEDHFMSNDEFYEEWKEMVKEKIGYENPLLDPDVWQKSYDNNLENHGGKHSSSNPKVQEKFRKTSKENYGYDNPAKHPKVKQRIKDVWQEKYGQPFPPQSLNITLPTSIEIQLDEWSPDNVVYTGDRKYWIYMEDGSKKNPDFIVLSDEELSPYEEDELELQNANPSKVIEAFGEYWHGPERTGMSKEAHQKEMISAYQEQGVECLIIWGSDLNDEQNKEEVCSYIRDFLGS